MSISSGLSSYTRSLGRSGFGNRRDGWYSGEYKKAASSLTRGATRSLTQRRHQLMQQGVRGEDVERRLQPYRANIQQGFSDLGAESRAAELRRIAEKKAKRKSLFRTIGSTLLTGGMNIAANRAFGNLFSRRGGGNGSYAPNRYPGNRGF